MTVQFKKKDDGRAQTKANINLCKEPKKKTSTKQNKTQELLLVVYVCLLHQV